MNLRSTERGSTLTGYALIVALVMVLGVGSIQMLDRVGGEVLVETGDQIGDMRPTLDDLRQNPNAPGPVTPQNPPPGPPADIVNPPAPQAAPVGHTFLNVNYQQGYASPILDLVPNPTLNPYQDDDLGFLFEEGGGAPPFGFIIPNSTGQIPGPSVCSMYLRFSARSALSSAGPFQINVPGAILGYAGTETELDNTDAWLGGQNPAGSIGFSPSRSLASDELSSISISGGSLTIPQLITTNTSTDELRIFYNC